MLQKQNSQYTDSQVNYDEYWDGGYAQAYSVFNHPSLIFKEFKNKIKAQQAFNIQNKLAQFDLAPLTQSLILQNKLLNWGFFSEKAKISHSIKLSQIQSLVDDIYHYCGLKFWDSHYDNVGLVIRNKKNKLVCIDTGKESFDGYCNAWGFAEPGPKCCYCLKYQCRCSEY